ncbi:hypothetical protein BDZ89DRAFT_1046261 [Hymenopellis radicata]|nr:hypothetical protein BDZ89DRAFT_1142016 [Hymenopellis radicata]KAF9014791.1 hypothetical protein BDZ89DRAFT_1046261 [Hymenopellis radicata]
MAEVRSLPLSNTAYNDGGYPHFFECIRWPTSTPTLVLAVVSRMTTLVTCSLTSALTGTRARKRLLIPGDYARSSHPTTHAWWNRRVFPEAQPNGANSSAARLIAQHQRAVAAAATSNA